MRDDAPGTVLSEGGPWGGSGGKDGEDKKGWVRPRPGTGASPGSSESSDGGLSSGGSHTWWAGGP